MKAIVFVIVCFFVGTSFAQHIQSEKSGIELSIYRKTQEIIQRSLDYKNIESEVKDLMSLMNQQPENIYTHIKIINWALDGENIECKSSLMDKILAYLNANDFYKEIYSMSFSCDNNFFSEGIFQRIQVQKK